VNARLPEVVECDRLLLRRWRVDDAPALRQAVLDSLDHLMPWMPWAAFEPTSIDDRIALINEWNEQWRAGGDVTLGVFLDDQPIGGTGLHRRQGDGTLEIGYWIHVDHVGCGYATELTRTLTSVGLTQPGIAEMCILHDAANHASRRIPEKLGYEHVGERAVEAKAAAESGVHLVWRTTPSTWNPTLPSDSSS
jgi:ribosomal-protein-serine acetyltransferase